jgi:hypothetical protein
MAEVHRLSPVARGSIDTTRPIRLVLHIGPHKTGSTSIQAALDRNYGKLLADGILYPSGIFPDRQHSSIFQVVTQGKEDAAARFFLSLRNLAASNTCHTVILSGEQISLFSEKHLRRVHAAVADANFDSLVVAFSRPPLGRLASQISQWMISYRQHFVTPHLLANAIKDFSVDAILEKFRRVFGAERVLVQDLAGGGDAVEMFASAAGIQLPAEARRNTRTDFAVMSFINAIKADFHLSPAHIHSA